MTTRLPTGVFFGQLLMTVAALVLALSGLCTGLALLAVLASSGPDGPWAMLPLPFEFGGIPLGAGGTVFLIGRRWANDRPGPRIGAIALLVGAAIIAATASPAWGVLVHGPTRPVPHELDFDPTTDPFSVPLAAASGLALVVTAVLELRRSRRPLTT